MEIGKQLPGRLSHATYVGGTVYRTWDEKTSLQFSCRGRPTYGVYTITTYPVSHMHYLISDSGLRR
jgi:hypothetical protein